VGKIDESVIRVWAPGRVNLIGEHTDYSGGLVLPVAIQHGIRVVAAPAPGEISLQSERFGRAESVAADGSGAPTRGWARYVQAVAAELADAGRPAIGLRGTVSSDLPPRAGLSSSAALEVALALALCAAADFALEPLVLARLCQRAELRAVGVPCGILDQAACLLGADGHAILLDCESLDHRLVPVPADAAFLIVDSGVSRSLESTAYAERRSELERALGLVGVTRSTDVETTAPNGLDDVPLRRLRHVVGENARVQRLVAALEAADLVVAGALLRESHASLRDDYEVSIPELDLLVELAVAAGAHGARLLGGGFGGSVLVLTDASHADVVGEAIVAQYRRRTGAGGDAVLVRASPGATCSRTG
jgi:galactokinase